MGQRIFTISPTKDTTPDLAIEMAYEFAHSLRRTGWAASDEEFAKSLWVEREFGDSPLLAYLVCGFEAGYRNQPRPVAEQLIAALPPKTYQDHRPLPH